MFYKGVYLTDYLRINKLYSIHYFEYMSNFIFEGESHDFWEFIYVDKGSVTIRGGDTILTLSKGSIHFHEPNEFHAVQATNNIAPYLIVIAFSCDDPSMAFFKNKTLSLSDTDRHLLADLLKEANDCIASPLNDPYLSNMILQPSSRPGAEQLIRLKLELFLINLIRKHSLPTHTTAINKKANKRITDSETFEMIKIYLCNHLHQPLSLDDICSANMIGSSQLHKLFKEMTGSSVIEYFTNLKIQQAKYMICTQNLNFTQIAEKLGYSSIHYFSRQFKKITGMSPSEYGYSVKALTEFPSTPTSELKVYTK